MKCQRCGNPLKTGLSSCLRCGAYIEKTKPTEAPKPEPKTKSQQTIQPQTTSNPKPASPFRIDEEQYKNSQKSAEVAPLKTIDTLAEGNR